MRFAAFIVGLLGLGVLHATPVVESIQGQLVLTRVLTRQRVVLPEYSVRGVTPPRRPDTRIAVREWDRVAVYLEGGNPPKAAPINATMTQSAQRFDPEMLVVPVGSVVSFPNSDPVFHNVFSLSRIREFDLGYYPAGQTRTVKFTAPGVVQVYCHLHSDMSASILVVPNGWYVRPDENGAFAFSAIPPGNYQVVVWHRSAGFFRKPIQISSGTTAKVSVEILLVNSVTGI